MTRLVALRRTIELCDERLEAEVAGIAIRCDAAGIRGGLKAQAIADFMKIYPQRPTEG
jgi:hypothetical protein